MQPRDVFAAIHSAWPTGRCRIYLPKTLPPGYYVPLPNESPSGTRAGVEAWDDGSSLPGYSVYIANGSSGIFLGVNFVADAGDVDATKTNLTVDGIPLHRVNGAAFLEGSKSGLPLIDLDGTEGSLRGNSLWPQVVEVAKQLVRVE